jgi:outer membrane protein OmpA-like peptidoglycan-associated protein
MATLKKVPPKPLPPAVLIFEGFAEENIYADENNPNSKVLGQKPLPYPNAVLNGMNIISDKDGYFTAPLDSGFNYNLRVTKEGYLSAELSFNTLNVKSKPGDTIIFKQKVILSKIFKDVEIVLDNIYYDFDKWDIREDARPTLDSLTQILKQNPNISIELASHTDCRGNDQYNQTLSQRRAESVVQYLISKGINPGRLTAKGYGESEPVETCECEKCTEEQHQRNRRTTFKIVKD